MAVRLNRNHSEICIKRIKTSQLINRLQNHALGQEEMTMSEVKSAAFLIERTLAKAVAPQKIELEGKVTLEQLVTGSLPVAQPDPSGE